MQQTHRLTDRQTDSQASKQRAPKSQITKTNWRQQATNKTWNSPTDFFSRLGSKHISDQN